MSALKAFNGEFIQIIRDVNSTRYSRMASNTVFTYEYLITLEDEIELIWKKRWSLPKVLFILNRYVVLCAMIVDSYVFYSSKVNHKLCVQYFYFEGCTGMLAFILSQGILQVRAYALYSLSKRLLVIMLISFVIGLGVSGYILMRNLIGLPVVVQQVPGGDFCGIGQLVPGFYTFWIPALVFECTLCIIVIVQGVRELEAIRSLLDYRPILIRILVRDAVIYLFVLSTIYIISMIFWQCVRASLAEAPIAWAPAMASILSNRVLIHVRDAYHQPESISLNEYEYDDA